MKFKKSDLMKIIKEEIKLFEKEQLNEGSTSAVEVEELLRAYARNAGGLPEDITRLSVLFPILERSGLKEVVADYIESYKTNPEEAKLILDDVKKAILAIRSNP